jgi:sugar/nucleoside kinase (ribokinase family)
MSQLGVVGNVSIDRSHWGGLMGPTSVGGAALYVALAATRAGLEARPLSVIGSNLEAIRDEPLLDILDLSGVQTVSGNSAVFTLNYDLNGLLTETKADYGASAQLTAHALEQIRSMRDASYHVCCRRPLDIARVLDALVKDQARFSLDFFVPSAAESIAAAANALPLAQMVFVNAAEYELLANVVPIRALHEVVVTDGRHPAQLIHFGSCIAHAIPPQITIVDVTGSGDTLAGTFLAARNRGFDGKVALEWAVREASAHAGLPALRLNW